MCKGLRVDGDRTEGVTLPARRWRRRRPGCERRRRRHVRKRRGAVRHARRNCCGSPRAGDRADWSRRAHFWFARLRFGTRRVREGLGRQQSLFQCLGERARAGDCAAALAAGTIIGAGRGAGVGASSAPPARRAESTGKAAPCSAGARAGTWAGTWAGEEASAALEGAGGAEIDGVKFAPPERSGCRWRISGWRISGWGICVCRVCASAVSIRSMRVSVAMMRSLSLFWTRRTYSSRNQRPRAVPATAASMEANSS